MSAASKCSAKLFTLKPRRVFTLKPGSAFTLKLSFEALRATTIDPDDWANAIGAWINEKTERRQKVSVKSLIQELVLDSAFRKGNPVTPGLQKLIEKFTATNQRFKEKYLRALCSNPRLIFDDKDLLLLENWRQLSPKLKKFCDRQGFTPLPGLRHWTPRAVEKLFNRQSIFTSKDGTNNDGFSEWFKTRKHRLGLRSIKAKTVTRKTRLV